MDDPRVSAAIGECLDRCQRSKHPLGALAVFLAGLRADPNWSESDLQQVETAVRQTLAGRLPRQSDVDVPGCRTGALGTGLAWSVAGDSEVPHSQSLRVLIADDNRDAADSLATLVRVWGHDVRVAYDGQSAINLAWEFLPQVVMVDFQMPEIHGGEVARQLRAKPEFQHAKIYVTSANSPDDPRLAAWRHLFDAHYVKPYNLTLLEELLANQINCDS